MKPYGLVFRKEDQVKLFIWFF